jgi:hypothetical protein
MKKGLIFLIMLLILSACSLPYESDAKNPYLTSPPVPDSLAPYVGEWTTAMTGTLTSIKIREDGSALMCSANAYFGETVGKVIKRGAAMELTFETSGPYTIQDVTADSLTLLMYRKSYIFQRGQVPSRCIAIFKEK